MSGRSTKSGPLARFGRWPSVWQGHSLVHTGCGETGTSSNARAHGHDAAARPGHHTRSGPSASGHSASGHERGGARRGKRCPGRGNLRARSLAQGEARRADTVAPGSARARTTCHLPQSTVQYGRVRAKRGRRRRAAPTRISARGPRASGACMTSLRDARRRQRRPRSLVALLSARACVQCRACNPALTGGWGARPTAVCPSPPKVTSPPPPRRARRQILRGTRRQPPPRGPAGHARPRVAGAAPRRRGARGL